MSQNCLWIKKLEINKPLRKRKHIFPFHDPVPKVEKQRNIHFIERVNLIRLQTPNTSSFHSLHMIWQLDFRWWGVTGACALSPNSFCRVPAPKVDFDIQLVTNGQVTTLHLARNSNRPGKVGFSPPSGTNLHSEYHIWWSYGWEYALRARGRLVGVVQLQRRCCEHSQEAIWAVFALELFA